MPNRFYITQQKLVCYNIWREKNNYASAKRLVFLTKSFIFITTHTHTHTPPSGSAKVSINCYSLVLFAILSHLYCMLTLTREESRGQGVQSQHKQETIRL